MTWPQNYAPLESGFLSTLVAAAPVVVLLGLLGLLHWRAHWAALAGLASAVAVAVFAFQMPPTLALASAGFGAAFGLFPIGWIVVNAIFIYELSVETGQFAALKTQIAGLAEDRRIQALLIAFVSAHSLRAAPDSARRWRSPARCSWASASNRSKPPSSRSSATPHRSPSARSASPSPRCTASPASICMH